MEKLTDQKVLLLEEEIMDRCGQHPMWMYFRAYRTDHAELSYESFLLQKVTALNAAKKEKERGCIQRRTPQSAGGMVLFPHQDVPSKKTVDLEKMSIGVSSKAYLTRMWRRLGNDPFYYYTQIKENAAEEWKDKDTFLGGWMMSHVFLPAGS